MSDSTAQPVVRDRARFARFYPENRAVIPPGLVEEVPFVSTRTLIARRLRDLQAQAAEQA
jgi:hypothetical protein